LQVPDLGLAFAGRVNALKYDLLVMPPSVHAFLREFYSPQLSALDLLLRDRFGFGIPESWRMTTTGDSGSDRYYTGGLYRTVMHGTKEMVNGELWPEFWQAMPKARELFDESVLEKLMAWLCENRDEAPGPKLLSSHSSHNLVAFEGVIYALPHELGVWDKWHEEDPASVPGVLVGPSLQAVVAMLDHQAQSRSSANAVTGTE
jgi:hypothetical protein